MTSIRPQDMAPQMVRKNGTKLSKEIAQKYSVNVFVGNDGKQNVRNPHKGYWQEVLRLINKHEKENGAYEHI